MQYKLVKKVSRFLLLSKSSEPNSYEFRYWKIWSAYQKSGPPICYTIEKILFKLIMLKNVLSFLIYFYSYLHLILVSHISLFIFKSFRYIIKKLFKETLKIQDTDLDCNVSLFVSLLTNLFKKITLTKSHQFIYKFISYQSDNFISFYIT